MAGMLPMASESMAIVNKSLETGGRGSSETSTNYSGITDAFMKKASLETQIGGMLADFSSKKADMLSGLEMGKAEIYMRGAEMAQREDFFNREMKAREEADKMSPFEQITGVLAGAAAPAAAGMAIGGPPGAIIGGVIGGAATMGAGNSRTRQQNIIGNLGVISKAGVAIKGAYTAKKAEDAGVELMKNGADIANALRQPENAPGTQGYADQMEKVDNLVANYGQAQIKAGRPMGEVQKEMSEYKKELLGGYDPSNPKMVANREIQGINAKYQANDAFMDPAAPGHRAAVQSYQMETAGAHMRGFGRAPTNAEMGIYTGTAMGQPTGQQYEQQQARVTSGISAMGSGGGNVASQKTGSTAQGVTKEVTGQSGQNTTYNTPARQSQDGTHVPNYVMQSSGASAGPSGGWGMAPDAGPQQVLQSAQENFSKAAAKDPSLINKALGRDQVEAGNIDLANRKVVNNKDGTISTEQSITIEEDGMAINIPTVINGRKMNDEAAIAHYHNTGEHLGKFNSIEAAEAAAEQVHKDQADRYGTENDNSIEKPKKGFEERALDFLNISGKKNERQLELENEREVEYQNRVTQKRNAEYVDMRKKEKPQYSSATEEVFKEHPDKIVEAFGIRKRFGYDKTLVDQAHNFESTAVQIKDFEKAVDNLADTDKPLTVGQMKTFQHFMQGEGDGAMKGTSSSMAGSGGGASVQLSRSEFERSLSTQMKGAGEMRDLTPDQVDKLYAVYQRQAPLVNILARSVGQEKGPLSEGDKAPFKQALFNSYDPDIGRNQTGGATMMDILFKNFNTSFGEGTGYESWDEKSAREGSYKRSLRKPVQTGTRPNDEWMPYNN